MALRTFWPNAVDFACNLIFCVAGASGSTSFGPRRLLPTKGNSWRKRLLAEADVEQRVLRRRLLRNSLGRLGSP